MKRTIAALLAAALPATAVAQDGAVLTLGLGAAFAPDYQGSDDYGLGPTGRFSIENFRLGRFSFGTPAPGDDQGFSVDGSFRIRGGRDSGDHSEIAGLDDIDTAVELGLGLRYGAPGYRAFANVRYGLTGHESLVGEVGADAVVRPNDRLTLTAGPRVLFGSDGYTDTYFGISGDEAAASGLAAYDPGGGLVSAGVELGMYYRFDENWGLRGTIGYDRLMGDAADSPIVAQGSRTQGRASLIVTRRVTFGF